MELLLLFELGTKSLFQKNREETQAAQGNQEENGGPANSVLGACQSMEGGSGLDAHKTWRGDPKKGAEEEGAQRYPQNGGGNVYKPVGEEGGHSEEN